MPIGLNPDKELYESLLGRIPNLHVIADVNKVLNIIEWTLSGTHMKQPELYDI